MREAHLSSQSVTLFKKFVKQAFVTSCLSSLNADVLLNSCFAFRHPHTQTHKQYHIKRQIQILKKYKPTHTQTHINRDTQADKYIHTHRQRNRHTHTHTHTHTHGHTHRHTYSVSLNHRKVITHTHIHTHRHTHTHTNYRLIRHIQMRQMSVLVSVCLYG